MNLNKEAMKKVAAMNESFNKSLSDLNRLLDGGKSEEVKVEDLLKSFEDGKLSKADLEKALKGSSKKESASSASESEEAESPIKGKGKGELFSSESESEEPGKVRKSLEAAMEYDEEIAAAVDVEPFLKSLALAVADIDDKIVGIVGKLSKSVKKMSRRIEAVEALSKAHARATSDAMELQKSIRETVDQIGAQPLQSTSMLRKSGDRFGSEQPSLAGVQRDRILSTALELRKSGKLLPVDVTLIEGRLNAGQQLEPRHADILAKSLAGNE